MHPKLAYERILPRKLCRFEIWLFRLHEGGKTCIFTGLTSMVPTKKQKKLPKHRLESPLR